ncbi:universal stress protein [Noviherbaspirillum denitrificans]|uniref:Universal stress protein n=1 Tax=Noviherbaspirillum denitrificans TaxID=1968433 RepID=A0A254TGV3_9BURK|nr:universal stress protein [Noviherbaspirillum denitrificans]OWW21886.1 universal stress protein [Noviherbaspirillum denitrificans]
MSYKTILVHADKCRHAAQYIDLAASIAVREDAHLVGVATTGVSHYIYQSGIMDPAMGASGSYLEQHLEALRERGRHALDDFETRIRKTEVRSWESALLDDEAGAGLALRARYADLLVVGQVNPDEPSPVVLPDFPEYVVLSCGRPVLVVPYAGRFEQVGKRVLVAWDAGVSATRAVVNSIPMLRHADIVEVAVFNAEDRGDAHGEIPGADIALYLARHGVKVNVIRQKTRIDVGSSLLSLAADLGSDMLVTGCYGHSRFREIMLGGVTRTLLESMTVPVLMSA